MCIAGYIAIGAWAMRGFERTWAEVAGPAGLAAEAPAEVVLAAGRNEFTRYTVAPRWK